MEEEVERLKELLGGGEGEAGMDLVAQALGREAAASLDLFDRCQLDTVIRAGREAKRLSDAGRILFSESRKAKSAPNDADRLRKYLARFDLEWRSLAAKK